MTTFRLENGLFGGTVSKEPKFDKSLEQTLTRRSRKDTCDPCNSQIRICKIAADVSTRSDSCVPQAVLSPGSVVNDVLSGKSRIALAITEPEAGSDVRGLQTEAVLSDDGARLIINGQKKVRHKMPVS